MLQEDYHTPSISVLLSSSRWRYPIYGIDQDPRPDGVPSPQTARHLDAASHVVDKTLNPTLEGVRPATLANDRALGGAILGGSILGIIVYGLLLYFFSRIILEITAFLAVVV